MLACSKRGAAHAERFAMALSDACFEFLNSICEAAEVLSKAVHYNSNPANAKKYGAEIDSLRRSCAAMADSPYDPDVGARLIRMAGSIITYQDTPPGTAASAEREGELKKLIRLLEEVVGDDEASAVAAVVANVAVETPFTESAAKRLKRLLPKLGKSAYEVAIKIISDVGSATAKKILGL